MPHDTIEELYNKFIESKTTASEDANRYDYATALLATANVESISEGVQHLEYLISNNTEYSKDSYYYIGQGYIQLKEYKKAEESIIKLIAIEPNNQEAIDLLEKIRYNQKKEYTIVSSIIGGICVGVGLLIGMTLNRRK